MTFFTLFDSLSSTHLTEQVLFFCNTFQLVLFCYCALLCLFGLETSGIEVNGPVFFLVLFLVPSYISQKQSIVFSSSCLPCNRSFGFEDLGVIQFIFI